MAKKGFIPRKDETEMKGLGNIIAGRGHTRQGHRLYYNLPNT